MLRSIVAERHHGVPQVPHLRQVVAESTGGSAAAWIGESALTGGGGVEGITNAFVSSLWYADWLGFAAR